ncbi:MAG: arabinose efflux permease, partial [Coleofasciculus sp. C2-GNP5-27]
MRLSESESKRVHQHPAPKKSSSGTKRNYREPHQPPRQAGKVPDSTAEPPVEPGKRGFVPVLKNVNFLTLWSGQVFSQLADKIYLVLMIALIASHFQQAGTSISGWVSALMIAFTIPAVLFGSLAGVFVDRWSKKAVLVSTNLLRG